MADRVPERHVEPGDRHADETLPAKQAEAPVESGVAFHGDGRLALYLLAELSTRLDQRRERQRRVAEQE